MAGLGEEGRQELSEWGPEVGKACRLKKWNKDNPDFGEMCPCRIDGSRGGRRQ